MSILFMNRCKLSRFILFVLVVGDVTALINLFKNNPMLKLSRTSNAVTNFPREFNISSVNFASQNPLPQVGITGDLSTHLIEFNSPYLASLMPDDSRSSLVSFRLAAEKSLGTKFLICDLDKSADAVELHDVLTRFDHGSFTLPLYYNRRSGMILRQANDISEFFSWVKGDPKFKPSNKRVLSLKENSCIDNSIFNPEDQLDSVAEDLDNGQDPRFTFVPQQLTWLENIIKFPGTTFRYMRKNRMSATLPALSIKDLKGSDQRAYVWIPAYIGELTKATKIFIPKSIMHALRLKDEDVKQTASTPKGRLQSMKSLAFKFTAPIIPYVLLERFEEEKNQITTNSANNVLEGPFMWALEKIISTFITI